MHVGLILIFQADLGSEGSPLQVEDVMELLDIYWMK
jgi:hypothetical protein